MSKSIKTAIQTSLAPAPVGPYNQAILANGWLFCSGQIALDPKNGELIGKGDIETETYQVLKNLFAVIKEAGANKSDVIRTTIYLTDLNDFNKVNKIYAEEFANGISPARACVEVSALPKGAKVEIDCIAFIN